MQLLVEILPMLAQEPRFALKGGTAGYGIRASELAAQYESITVEAVHRDVIHLFPQKETKVLDIGARTRHPQDGSQGQYSRGSAVRRRQSRGTLHS